MLKSVLLFYKKLRNDLESEGFKINPYNPCVANEIINGSQMMIAWHLDDLKISHQDGWEVTKTIKWLGKIYGDIMDFEERGVVRVSMIPHVQDIIKKLS